MTDKRPLFNPKCAAIAAGGVGLWYVFPTRDSTNHLLWAIVLASGIYVAISWYDVLYNCEQKSWAGGLLTDYMRRFKPSVGESGRYDGKSI